MVKKSAPQLTQGAVEFAKTIEREGLGVNEAGAAIEAPDGMVSRLLRGERLPSIWWASKIEERFSVPMRLWAQGVEKSSGAEAAA